MLRLKTTKSLFILLIGLFFLSCRYKTTNAPIIDIAWQSDKFLWVVQSEDIIRWNTENKENRVFSNMAGDLFIDSRNKLWVFEVNRFSQFDKQDWKHYQPSDGFAGGQVFAIKEDNGFLWVGTEGGLSRYDQEKQFWEIILSELPGPEPTPIPEDTYAEILNEGVHAISPINPNKIWIGTSKGLTYWDQGSLQTWSNTRLNTDGVRCILAISDKEIWVCTNNGIGLWNGEGWTNFGNGLHDPVAIFQGTGEEIWAITRESGIAQWNGETWNNWTRHDGLAGNRPYSLVVSKINNDIWVGTSNGINRWDENNWQTYNTANGLDSNKITALFEDSIGILWAGTNKGLNYYDTKTDQWRPFP